MKTLTQIVLLGLLAIVICSAVTIAVMHWTKRIPASANVKTVGIGVYEDMACTVPVTEIDWHMIEPGENKTFPAYIKNESNVVITLTMQTEEWMPETAASYIHLSWDYAGELIPLDAKAAITFVLSVDLEIAGIQSFAFTIVIVGSG